MLDQFVSGNSRFTLGSEFVVDISQTIVCQFSHDHQLALVDLDSFKRQQERVT